MKSASFALLGLVCGSASASPCDNYLGSSVTPYSFEQALTRVPVVEAKGEFETTAQFTARQAAASAALGTGPLIISKAPEDLKHLQYDADQQRLAVISYAFHNMGFSAWDAIYETPYASALNPSTTSNINVVISRSEKLGGTYASQNAYGAKATVQRITRKVAVIFDRPVDYKSDGFMAGLFPAADKSPYAVGYLSMSPADAQKLKPALKLAFVVAPKPPYILRSKYGVGKTTVTNPTDITEEATILVGDIQCGLLLDAGNKVLGAYPTR